jgi:hypothetical protein
MRNKTQLKEMMRIMLASGAVKGNPAEIDARSAGKCQVQQAVRVEEAHRTR